MKNIPFEYLDNEKAAHFVASGEHQPNDAGPNSQGNESLQGMSKTSTSMGKEQVGHDAHALDCAECTM